MRPDDATPGLEERLALVTRKISRLVDALTIGSEELPSVRGALVDLERERTAWRVG
jgi:hypothetical protein